MASPGGKLSAKLTDEECGRRADGSCTVTDFLQRRTCRRSSSAPAGHRNQCMIAPGNHGYLRFAARSTTPGGRYRRCRADVEYWMHAAFRGSRKGNYLERNQKLTPLSQTLRKKQTKEEKLLWYQFLRQYPCRFRRQYIIGNYIADFYCHQARLVIELDGSGHYNPETAQKDRTRTQYLESMGLKVLRFTNLDILQRFGSVCEQIDLTVKERTAEHPSGCE